MQISAACVGSLQINFETDASSTGDNLKHRKCYQVQGMSSTKLDLGEEVLGMCSGCTGTVQGPMTVMLNLQVSQ
jgi:hypothetical protein